MPARSLVLLAGPSGSGKSRVARLSGAFRFRLDDFYFDADHPGLPRWGEIVDWDDPATWDADGAVASLRELLETGRTRVPVYDISLSRRTGMHDLVMPEGDTVIVAEGIFAVDLIARCQRSGLPVTPIWIDRPRAVTFALRLKRDLQAHRKPPVVSLRRGVALARHEPQLRAKAVANGFRPLGLDESVATIQRLS
ncbi:MAG: uridine kinase [Propionibacteriaceae bacterium]